MVIRAPHLSQASHRRAYRTRRAALGIASLGAMLAGGAQRVAAASPTPSALKVAETMIDACFRQANAAKFPPISMAIADAGGHLVAFRRQDGASIASGEVAVLKARTAALADTSTAILSEVAAQDVATRETLTVLGLTAIAGGRPFELEHGRLRGAVGVSGGSVEQDTACGTKAVAAAASTDS